MEMFSCINYYYADIFYVGMSFVDFYEFIPAGKTVLRDIIMRPRVA